MSVSSSERVNAAPDVLFRLVGDEGVLLNLRTQQYLGLNPVGTRVWTVLEHGETIQAAYDTVLREYDVEPVQLRLDLDRFIGQLVEHELVEHAGHAPGRDPR
jgi:Coenzyme PQQ synthesis protein D (PqqD)